MYIMEYPSLIGKLVLAERNGALVGVWMEGQKYFMGSLGEEEKVYQDTPILLQTRKWLDNYFAGKRPSISELKLKPEGSAFQKEVWDMLCDIPYGHTITYGEIAKKIAVNRGFDHMSAQAVGGAVGHNPIAIIIPCHRVIGANGSLTGYAGGIEKKIKLLSLEGVIRDRGVMPG